MIPAAEVDKILATAGRYEGLKKKPVRVQAEIRLSKPKMKSAWQEFIRAKRNGQEADAKDRVGAPLPGKARNRQSALRRLTRRAVGNR